MTHVAVVTVVHGRHEHLERQQHWLRRLAPTATRVVVAVADPAIGRLVPDATVVEVPSDPDRLRIAHARNVGAARALAGGAEVVVFLDVDCLPGPGLIDKYAAHTRVGLLLSGPVTYLDEGVLPADDADPRWFAEHRSPHPARPDPPYDEVVTGAEPDLFWSLSFAVTAPTWQRLGGFHEGYEGYGGEDTDLGWTARDRGVELAWLGGADAFHQHHPVSQPPVEHLEDILRNGAVFARRWGRWPMEGWLRELAGLGLVEHVDGEWRATREREELHA